MDRARLWLRPARFACGEPNGFAGYLNSAGIHSALPSDPARCRGARRRRADSRSARKWLRILTAEPHVAGTPADYKTAIFVRDKLREWGWKAELAELEVLLNYPLADRPPSLEIQRPFHKALNLDEAPISTDKDSASTAAFGAFNGYGVSGDASGQVIYANYGRPEDYQALEKLGIDVKGKIVLARYGGLFRGLKVLNAQKRGAKGILIYSDPADDGYAKGDVYPERSLSTRLGDPARQRPVPLARTGRSIDAAWTFHQGSEAASHR